MKRRRLFTLVTIEISLLLLTTVPSLFGLAVADTSAEVIVPGFAPYSQIPKILEELNASDRVQIQIIGQSVNGYDLYLATVADPVVLDRLDDYRDFAQLTVKDPELAWELVENGTVDYRATVFITGSQHGDEMMGTDACLDILKLLANSDSQGVKDILDNTISLVYVCVNPDGRVTNMRENGNYINLNRDWLTASQPEVRAGIEIYREWAPLVNIDLHGYIGKDTVLIEPCTPLHNPNAEEDLLLKHLLPMAIEMETAIQETGIDTIIPYRDWTAAWDDYPPIFAPMYGFYHGCFGITFESTDPYHGNGSPATSIGAHYTGTLAAYEYVVENKNEMFEDQTAIFKRGIRNEDHWLNGQPGSFPHAYILPMDPDLQMNPIETARMVDTAMFHGLEVHVATEPFIADTGTYPAGTYVILMNQPRAGLSMNMFWHGEDTSWAIDYPPYDTYAWNFPEMRGFTRIKADSEFNAKLDEVTEASYPEGGVLGEVTYGYALKGNTNDAIRMVNRLLNEGITIYSATESFNDTENQYHAGAFIILKQEGDIAETAKSLHLTLYGLSQEPAHKKLLTLPEVALLYDSGIENSAYGETQFALRSLEFSFEVLDYNDVEKGRLENYDIAIIPDGTAKTVWTRLAGIGRKQLLSFIDAGGTYLGFGEGGGYFLNYAKFLNALAYRTERTRSLYGGYVNGIVRLDYDPTNPIAAYYPEESYAYAFFPVWFEVPVGSSVNTVASYASDNMFLAGWWPNNEQAEGHGAIIQGTYGDGNIILSGINPTFRGHTEFTFRLVANTILFAASE